MTAQHSMAEMGRYWNHPEVQALRKVAGQAKKPAEVKAALNAVRDKVAQLKAAE